MRVACLSDIHGFLPQVPDCDLLLLAGDYVRGGGLDYECLWLNGPFADWLEDIRDRGTEIVGVAGNHDWPFQLAPNRLGIPHWRYLQDYGCEVLGKRIWGSPWQPRFFDWAFNADAAFLAERWAAIPADTDILLLHGPPQGIGDFSPYDKVHTGSPSLRKRIEEVKPKLVVSGHIHADYGIYDLYRSPNMSAVTKASALNGPYKAWSDRVTCVNAAHVNEAYEPVNPVIVVDLP